MRASEVDLVANAAPSRATAEEFAWLLRNGRAPMLRGIRRFAEDELVLPDGPRKGRRFTCETQPYSALWLDAIDSGHWTHFAATGPSQSGKTLMCFVLPILWHLFEHRETVVVGLPEMDMAADKWLEDIQPVIERTRYRDLLPRSGTGSRGGTPTSIRFAHGCTLRFMGAGGGDKQRAAFTAPVLVATEVDGIASQSSESSHEADKLEQMKARTLAFRKVGRARIYLECTVTVAAGRIWQEYTNGTHSRIYRPCPHCHAWVMPEREHLHGWQDAEDELAARVGSHFCCPECGDRWSEAQRLEANTRSKLVHKGQHIDADGQVHGDLPRTNCLGFRWSAADNNFVGADDLGADEFKAVRSIDEDNAERRQCQFVWCQPYTPPTIQDAPLTADGVRHRFAKHRPRGLVPANTMYTTLGVDIGKWLAHWTLIAWLDDGRSHVVDYGVQEIPSDAMDVERAIVVGLRELRDIIDTGWTHAEHDTPLVPRQVWIDSKYQPASVFAFCRESAVHGSASARIRPAQGFGQSRRMDKKYAPKHKTTKEVQHIGERYHIVLRAKDRFHVVYIDVDHWKLWLHHRLSCKDDAPGAMTLFTAAPNEHIKFAKHMTSERLERSFKPGKGQVITWVNESRNNHWLDSSMLACAAGHLCGFRLLEEARQPMHASQITQRPASSMTMPDGRPYLITERSSS